MMEQRPHSELVDDVREALLGIKQRTEGPDPYVNGLYRDAIDALASLDEQLEAVQRSNAEHRTGWEKCTDRESQLLEQLEAAQDALRDILDLATGWTRPMVDDDRKELIERVATAALNPAIVQSAAGENPDAAGGNSGRSAPSPASEPEAS